MKKDIDFNYLKQQVDTEIKDRGLDSIFYVLFDEKKRLPWAFHLFYRDGNL